MFRRTRAFTLASGLLVAGLLGAACSDDSSDDEEAGSEEESDSGARDQRRHPRRGHRPRHAELRRQQLGAGLRLRDGRRHLRRLRHRLLQGDRRRGPRRSRGRRVRPAHARAALPVPRQRRDRRAGPQHHLDVHPGRGRGRRLRDHDVLRRPGDDGPGRLGRHVHRRAGGLHDLPDRRHDDRAEPGRPHGRHPAHAADLRGERSGPGGVPGRAVRRLDLRPVPARRHPLQLARRPGRPAVADDPRRDVLEGAARPRRSSTATASGSTSSTGSCWPPSRPRSSASPPTTSTRCSRATIRRCAGSWASRSRSKARRRWSTTASASTPTSRST